MGKLRVLSGREACRILQRYGFVEVRRRGSHVVMQRSTDAGSTEALIDTKLVKLERALADLKTVRNELAAMRKRLRKRPTVSAAVYSHIERMT